MSDLNRNDSLLNVTRFGRGITEIDAALLPVCARAKPLGSINSNKIAKDAPSARVRLCVIKMLS